MNLQEQITRIQSMMGVINEKLEDIQGTPLYHHTTESRALSIMNSDMMRGTKPDDDMISGQTSKAAQPTSTQGSSGSRQSAIGTGVSSIPIGIGSSSTPVRAQTSVPSSVIQQPSTAVSGSVGSSIGTHSVYESSAG